MGIHFDTAHIVPDERAELIRQTIWDTVVRVEIKHNPDPARIRATGLIHNFGRLSVCSVRSNATTIQRTSKLSHDDLEPSLFLGLQVTGSSLVMQGGRHAVLGPGDLALYDTTSPYTLLNDNGIHQHYFRIPRTLIALPVDAINRVTAVRLGPENPIAPLAAAYFTRLATDETLRAPRVADTLGQPSIELIRALIAAQLGDARLAADSGQETLLLRVLEFIRAHLGESDLTPARIAMAHNISVRRLYTVLARADIGLGEWIRTQRLEECRTELARVGTHNRTIASIARRWGFVDATHFSRAFRETYGLTPRQWRAASAGSVGPKTLPNNRPAGGWTDDS